MQGACREWGATVVVGVQWLVGCGEQSAHTRGCLGAGRCEGCKSKSHTLTPPPAHPLARGREGSR